MNHRPIAVKALLNFISEFSNYTLGQILYSILVTLKIENRRDLLKVKDEELFNAVQKTIENERE